MGVKRTSRPKTTRVSPAARTPATRTPSKGTRATHKTPAKGTTSSVEELRPKSERPTAHPGDVKEAMLPELRRLFIAEDYETVLPLAEGVLAASPDDEVKAIVATCRTRLTERYALRIGRMARVPILKVPPKEWTTLALDHRECFLLVHVDDVSSFEMIFDLSGMPRHEALRILCDLLERGIIAV